MMRYIGRFAVAMACLVGLVLNTQPVQACPFCGPQGKTLMEEMSQATFVLFGTLKNAKSDFGSLGGGTTDMEIETILKESDHVKGKKSITLPRFVPLSPETPKFLVFCDIHKGRIDAYRGVSFTNDSKVGDYLQAALALKGKDMPTRLMFFFDYLEAADREVSEDAYREFGYADYADFRKIAGKLPPDQVRTWLLDPATSSARFGLYGSMLGHCGNANDAKLIREILDDTKRLSSGIDGVFAGYIMLDRQAGWDYLMQVLKNDNGKTFVQRYAGLRSMRFFWDYRPDLIPRKQLVEGMNILADQKLLSDLAIEDLRKRECWESMPHILSLAERESHRAPIIQRAILRFALAGQASNSQAREYVAQARKSDPELVNDAQALLDMENRPVAPKGK